MFKQGKHTTDALTRRERIDVALIIAHARAVAEREGRHVPHLRHYERRLRRMAGLPINRTFVSAPMAS